jgi:hypothetical protein
MLTTALAMALAIQAARLPLDARQLMVSQPVSLLEISADKLKGFPIRLSWSPDGRQLYLRAVQRDIWANEKEWHYVVNLPDGLITSVDREPEWSGHYWAWKSAALCPGTPALRIETESRVERKTPTNSGAGGSIAQNSGDPYALGFELGPQGAAIIASAMQAQMVNTTTLKLKGRLLCTFVNTPVMLGLMYGWAPEGLQAIAYANERRALVVMDSTGTQYEIKGTKGVLLPAWSTDGRRIAWVSQQGRKKLAIKTTEVGK